MGRLSRRNFLSLFNAVDVDDAARGPAVSDDIQMVYIADDLTRLIAPASPTEGFVSIGLGVIVLRVRGIAFTPPANSAAIITWMRNESAIDSLYEVVSPAVRDLTDDLAAGTIDFVTGPLPARSTFQTGSKAVQTVGVVLPAGENMPERHPELVVLPGQILLWVGTVINTAVTFSWSWREVPV